MFCIIDIIHHRNKVKIPTNTLNRLVLEVNQESLTTPNMNLKFFDTCEEDQLNENDQTEIIENENPFHRVTSENGSCRSSALDTTRDVLTRRHALDSTEKQDLRIYMRHRRDSIVQHVIGYNYDDNSIVGGLYTRVGIGSKIKKKDIYHIEMNYFSFLSWYSYSFRNVDSK